MEKPRSKTVSLSGVTPSLKTNTTGQEWDLLFCPRNATLDWATNSKHNQNFNALTIGNYTGFHKVPKPRALPKSRNYLEIFRDLEKLYRKSKRKDSTYEALFERPFTQEDFQEYDKLFKSTKLQVERNKRTSQCVLCEQVNLSRKLARFSATCSRCKLCPTCYRVLEDKMGPGFKCITRMVERARHNRASQCARRKGEEVSEDS